MDGDGPAASEAALPKYDVCRMGECQVLASSSNNGIDDAVALDDESDYSFRILCKVLKI